MGATTLTGTTHVDNPCRQGQTNRLVSIAQHYCCTGCPYSSKHILEQTIFHAIVFLLTRQMLSSRLIQYLYEYLFPHQILDTLVFVIPYLKI